MDFEALSSNLMRFKRWLRYGMTWPGLNIRRVETGWVYGRLKLLTSKE